MILMWLGPVVLAIVALYGFSLAVSACLRGLQNRFLALPPSTSIPNMMVTAKLCSIGLGSFLRTQYSAVALLNSRCSSRRYGILLMCLSVAGTWTTMLALAMAWQVNGAAFLGLAFILYLYLNLRHRSLELFYFVFGLGTFLVAMQLVLQQQSTLMMALGESDLHFMIADGRFPAQLLWLVVSFALTLLIGVESWAVIIAVVLVVGGSMSLNGGVALIIGEMLAHVWMLWWRSRKLNQDTVALVKGYAIANTVGLVLAFFVAGFMRNAFAWTITFEGNQLTEKSWQFFSLYFVIMVVQCLAVLTWGHFAAQKKVDEVQRGEYFSTIWISQGLVRSSLLDFILKKLNERLDLLHAQQRELDAKDRAQIPAAFLKEHDHEITQLAVWLPLAIESRQKNKI